VLSTNSNRQSNRQLDENNPLQHLIQSGKLTSYSLSDHAIMSKLYLNCEHPNLEKGLQLDVREATIREIPEKIWEFVA
jgi:hypothetical protein